MSPSSETVTFTLQNTLCCHTKAVNCLAISPDKTHLISIGALSYCLTSHYFTQAWLGDDARTIVWSIASGEKLFVAELPFNGAAMAVSWASHDCSRFVVGFSSGDLHLFWSKNEKVIKTSRLKLILSLLHLVVPWYYQRFGWEGACWRNRVWPNPRQGCFYQRKFCSALENQRNWAGSNSSIAIRVPRIWKMRPFLW